MANVLPPNFQKVLLRQERARLIIAASLVALVCALAAFAALLPGYIMLALSGAAAASQAPDTGADRATLVAEQSLVSALSPLVSATTTPTQAIAAALSLRPSGVSITHVNYQSGSLGLIVLSGTASDAGKLNAYQTLLSQDKHFTGVEIPVGALVGANNGAFTIRLSGDF